MFLNILVAVDGSSASRRALAVAADLARAENSRLTLITVAPTVSRYSALGGVNPNRLEGDLQKQAAGILAEARAGLPEDVIAHTVQRQGQAGPEIVNEVARGGYDLVVVGSRGRGRAREGFLGSVNGHLHFKVRVPILSVPEGEEAEQDG
jgi:nucleotide-binding universal stress UspA family protein